MSSIIVRIASSIYARLLHAYPRELRARFGDQMVADFQAQCADALRERGGALAIVRWLFHAVADLGWNACVARIVDAVPAARRVIRVLRPHPGSFALAIVVVVAPIVLLGKAFAAGQPVLAGHAAIYTAIMMLAVSTGTSLRASDSPLGRAIRSVTRLAVAFTTLGVIVCWMVEPTSLGAVLTLDFRPLLLAVVTVTLATVFAGVSRLLRLR